MTRYRRSLLYCPPPPPDADSGGSLPSRRLAAMSRLSLGLLAGLASGALSAASMLAHELSDKRAALVGPVGR